VQDRSAHQAARNTSGRSRQVARLHLDLTRDTGARLPGRMEADPYRLDGIELATALVYGTDPTVAPLSLEEPTPRPRIVLESILRAALRHPPCVIGFSGGRDSSALVALAADVARREGLQAPIAATNVFPGDTQAAESHWQELLVRHVGLQAWERLRFTEELDVVGPVAAPLLRRFGPTFPFNGHFGMPSVALAAGGSYLTGVGGDELFEPNELTRPARVLTGQVRPERRDLVPLLRLATPTRVRAQRLKRMLPPEPWLRPEAAERFLADIATTLARQRLWYDDQIRFDVWRERSRAALQRTLGAFAATVGVEMVHPFEDSTFLRSVAVHRGHAGWRTRAHAMAELFGDVLPAEIVNRTSKASFDTIFFNEPSRMFARAWDGRGVDTTIVDVERLRAAWSAPTVDARSLSLLQAAWCHGHTGR
jgi:hypothetical protein